MILLEFLPLIWLDFSNQIKPIYSTTYVGYLKCVTFQYWRNISFTMLRKLSSVIMKICFKKTKLLFTYKLLFATLLQTKSKLISHDFCVDGFVHKEKGSQLLATERSHFLSRESHSARTTPTYDDVSVSVLVSYIFLSVLFSPSSCLKNSDLNHRHSLFCI